MHHPWRKLRDDYPEWRVDWCCIEGVLAEVVWESRTIRMDRRLSQAQRRSTVCHELFHLDRGPLALDPVLAAREDVAVERLAARTLIGLAELGEALAWTPHVVEAADVLWVDEPLLRVRLANLRTSERNYLRHRLASLHTD